MVAAVTFRSESCDYYTLILEGDYYEESLREGLTTLEKNTGDVSQGLDVVSFAGDINIDVVLDILSDFELEGN